MSRPDIGKSNLGGERKKKNYFKIKDGNNIYRILPAMFDLAANGRWSLFHRVEFGYVNSEGRMKPFISPRVVTRDGMVEVESAAHLNRLKLKDEFETLKQTIKQGLDAGTITKDEAKAALDEQKDLIRRYNLDSKHYMNVVNENGEIGLLKIPNTAKKALQPILDKLKSEGVDPMSVDNGRLFNFHRTGKSLDTVYTVSVVTDTINHPELGKVEKAKVSVLGDALLDRLNDEAFKLDQLFPTPSAEEVERIVNEGPNAVDEILAPKKASAVESVTNKVAEQKVAARTEAVAEDNEDNDVTSSTAVKTAAPAASTAKTAAPAAAAKSAPEATASSGSDDDEDVDAWLDQFEA